MSLATAAALYGVDVYCVDDELDPGTIATGELNVACAMARRLLTQPEALTEIGDTIPYDCIDVRDWLGRRGSFGANDRSDLDDLQVQAIQVLRQDPRVASVQVQATYAQGLLTVSAQGQGSDGPFSFVLSVSAVTAPLLRIGP